MIGKIAGATIAFIGFFLGTISLFVFFSNGTLIELTAEWMLIIGGIVIYYLASINERLKK